MMKKQFKDTAIGGFLSNVAPGLIDTVGDVFPPANILKGLIKTDHGMSEDQKAEAQKLIKDYEIEVLKMELDDRKDARAMQEEAIKSDDKFVRRFVYWLAAGSLIAGFSYVFFITFQEIPKDNQRFADTILGVVIATIITTIYNFFFGSSDGSKKKDEKLIK